MSRHLAIAFESTWGTLIAVDDPGLHFVEVQEESLQLAKNYIQADTIGSASTRDLIAVNEIVEGEVTVEGNYQDFAHYAKALLGDVETAGAGPFTHTSPHPTNGLADPLGLTLELLRDTVSGDTDALCLRFAGCLIERLTLNAALDDIATVQLGFVGKSVANQVGVSNATYPARDLIVPKHIGVQIDDTPVDCLSAEITIERALDRPLKLGSNQLGRIPRPNAPMRVSGTYELYADDAAQFDKFTAESDVKTELVISDGTHSVTITSYKAKIRNPGQNVSGRDRLTEAIEWEGYFNTAATENVEVVTVNDEATIT